MQRRTFIRTSLGAAAGAAVGASSARKRPNVILFLTDDQGWGDLGIHGNKIASTPHIDAFAREPSAFDRFYVSPVCAPTRASLLTGRWSFRTGVTSVQKGTYEMSTREVTLAESLRASGYSTAVFGKWHLGEEDSRLPYARGFEESIIHRDSGLYPGARYFNPKLLHNGEWRQFEGYCQEIWINEAIRYLTRCKRDGRPFFLYLPTNLVHTPLVVQEHHLKTYQRLGLPDQAARVYAMQNSIDEAFGRLLAALKELGYENDTLLLYTSDNGPQGHACEGRYIAGLRGAKGMVYENGIRVPCFVRWPGGGLKAGRRIGRIAAHIDVMPTVLEACGAALPRRAAMDGRSLLPLLDGRVAERDSSDRTFYFQWDARDVPERGLCFAVMNQRYKLVQARGNLRPQVIEQYAQVSNWHGPKGGTIAGPPKYELFDIEADPGERNDIAARLPRLVEEMKRQYEAWFEEVWIGRERE